MKIRKQLLIPLALYTVGIAALLLCNLGAFRILSTVRAIIVAEGIWSKAEKNAILNLRQHAFAGDEAAYFRYQTDIGVIESDSRARAEILKAEPDFAAVDASLIGGGSDPDDVRMIGYLLHYGRAVPLIDAALRIWEEGDGKIAKLKQCAEELRQRFKAGELTHDERERYFGELGTLNSELTELERRFSEHLAQAASVLQDVVIWSNLIAVLLVAAIALSVAWRISTGISRTLEKMVALLVKIRAGEKSLRMQEGQVGELGSLAAAINDLLDSEARKDARLAEQLKFEMLVKALNRRAIVAITDEDGLFVNVNDKICEISGYAEAELLGKHIRILDSGHHSEEFFTKMWKQLRADRVWSGEVCRRARDGNVYWVDCSITPIVDTEGQRRYLHIEYDITGRKSMEQQSIHISKMLSLGEMSAGMAHEINNPSGIILLLVRRLKRALAQPASERSQMLSEVEKIEIAANRIVAIVKGLLDFAHVSSSDPYLPTSLRLICEQALGVCKARIEAKGIELMFGDRTVLSHDLDALVDFKSDVRAGQIVQVLVSLLNNSIDAIEDLPAKWIHIGLEPAPNRRVRLSVTDSGGGISPEVADKIMQPFFTTKDVGKGTGMGLSIARGIVEAHGGSLELDWGSRNTRFVIELPLEQNENLAAA